jgi:hypothetical protein
MANTELKKLLLHNNEGVGPAIDYDNLGKVEELLKKTEFTTYQFKQTYKDSPLPTP